MSTESSSCTTQPTQPAPAKGSAKLLETVVWLAVLVMWAAVIAAFFLVEVDHA